MAEKIIEKYLKTLSEEDRKVAEELCKIINSVSKFKEAIAYGMPAFRYKSKIVACFRVHKIHIGLYPYSGSILPQFPIELAGFKTSVGAVQFPKKGKLPKAIIVKIIKARMKEIDDKLKQK